MKSAACTIRRHGLDVFQSLDAIKSDSRKWSWPLIQELRQALSWGGLSGYTERYYALTNWRIGRAS